ncbi:24177_t:CDS:2, partial [Entrophospora sp. SA101]
MHKNPGDATTALTTPVNTQPPPKIQILNHNSTPNGIWEYKKSNNNLLIDEDKVVLRIAK